MSPTLTLTLTLTLALTLTLTLTLTRRRYGVSFRFVTSGRLYVFDWFYLLSVFLSGLVLMNGGE